MLAVHEEVLLALIEEYPINRHDCPKGSTLTIFETYKFYNLCETELDLISIETLHKVLNELQDLDDREVYDLTASHRQEVLQWIRRAAI